MGKIFTIGFTKKSARQFFTKLHDFGVKRVIDIRLNNTSQLAGWAKMEDLRFFLEERGIDYVHAPLLAPTKELMDAYKKQKGDWTTFEQGFLGLLSARREQIEREIDAGLVDGACLLCSEDAPQYCHRRLVAEYFRDRWPDVEVTHIV